MNALTTPVAWQPSPGSDLFPRSLGKDGCDRVLYVLHRVITPVQREPLLSEAMTGAFRFADPAVAAEMNTVAELAQARLTRVRHEGEPSAVRAVARIIDRVRLSNLVARVTRRATAATSRPAWSPAARLLLR